MRRREFVALAGVAVAWPLAARAQQPAMPVVGFLNGVSPHEFASRVAAFREGLSEAGYVEGRNVEIEYRWAEGHYDRLPGLAIELVKRPTAVIAAAGGGARPAIQATTRIPIVFVTGEDPVKAGLVASLNRPGGNATGVAVLASDLVQKRLEVIRALVPAATVISILVNPTVTTSASDLRAAQAAARDGGFQLHVGRASTESEIEEAFATIRQQGSGALLTGGDPFFESRRDQLVELASRYAVPAIYDTRDYAEAGGLLSYGTDYRSGYHQAGVYVGRILAGAKPADLPVLELAKIELVINLRTAKALGLAIPQSILARADEVIE